MELIHDRKRRSRYRKLYKSYGILMIVLPSSAAALTFSTVPDYAIIVAETSALWVFAAFWLTKSREVDRQVSVLEQDFVIDPVHAGVAAANPSRTNVWNSLGIARCMSYCLETHE